MTEAARGGRQREVAAAVMPGEASGQTNVSSGPVSVLVTRRHHPFDGQSLAVLGQMRRHGTIELLVVLPDGSKTLLPEAWTDRSDIGTVGGGEAAGEGPTTLGSLEDLLAAQALVSALEVRARQAGRGQAAGRPPCKEDDRATCPAESDRRGRNAATPETGRVTATGPARRRHRDAGGSDRQGMGGAERGGRR